MTKNARYILETINSSKDHLTAEQIYLTLKEKNCSVAQATVYNNLASLYQQGLIRKISVEGYPDRYDNVIQHDHLVCRSCGKLSDIRLEDLTEKIQSQVGIPMFSYDLKIQYICEECKKKEQKNAGSERTGLHETKEEKD